MWFWIAGFNYNPGVFQLGFSLLYWKKQRMFMGAFIFWTIHFGWMKRDVQFISMDQIRKLLEDGRGEN